MHKLQEFDYVLPKELIAQTPARPRDHARLLIYDRRTKKMTDDFFYNLQEYLPKDTTLVLNNSKVEKCRLRFGNSEIFILHSADPYTVKALVRPGRRFKTGMYTTFRLGLHALKVETLSVDSDGVRILKFSRPLDDPLLEKYKATPFPPYIAPDETLAPKYQTVYAQPSGSKAAPTAGLHFTKGQLSEIAKKHSIAKLTLHVGLGTFAPVKSENIDRHKMHGERYEVPEDAAKLLNAAKHITAVGTTAARTLESLSRPFQPSSGETKIFIRPGYEFKNVDALITNFHLPKSTLLMLVAAFVGSVEQTHRIYRHAIAEKYRFYSFGDAMLIL